mmetsp:Transcript_21815/g.60724  ORF Transcript_21815/g.60724 Transcript_21815/m.60724 type:complete len:128 (+) Transcript_21815:1161-1544(+)
MVGGWGQAVTLLQSTAVHASWYPHRCNTSYVPPAISQTMRTSDQTRSEKNRTFCVFSMFCVFNKWMDGSSSSGIHALVCNDKERFITITGAPCDHDEAHDWDNTNRVHGFGNADCNCNRLHFSNACV